MLYCLQFRGVRGASACKRERRQQDRRLCGGQCGSAKLLYCRQVWGSGASKCCAVVNLGRSEAPEYTTARGGSRVFIYLCVSVEAKMDGLVDDRSMKIDESRDRGSMGR